VLPTGVTYHVCVGICLTLGLDEINGLLSVTAESLFFNGCGVIENNTTRTFDFAQFLATLSRTDMVTNSILRTAERQRVMIDPLCMFLCSDMMNSQNPRIAWFTSMD
jgi:hypothetical protein